MSETMSRQEKFQYALDLMHAKELYVDYVALKRCLLILDYGNISPRDFVVFLEEMKLV